MKKPTALWYNAQYTLSLCTEELRPPKDGEIVLEALFSGISRGTESIVFNGKIPKSEWCRMRCPYQQGSFPFPVKYGYGFVGRIMNAGGAKNGKVVFTLHPHQSLTIVAADDAIEIPADVPERRAILAANMETAMNVVWDARISIGDRVVVVGAGVVGLLIAWLAQRIPGTDVTITDTNADKRNIAASLGLPFCRPNDLPADRDVAINASASGEGLRTALMAAGFEARVIEASWYGDRSVTLPLGEGFHTKRLSIISSQVGAMPSDRQARWTHRRRLEKALSLLADPRLDNLITHEIAFERVEEELPPLFADTSVLSIALRYPASKER